jgi:hypothetical protein
VSLHDLPDDCQPEPRAGHPASAQGTVEAVEDVRQIGLRDPWPVVSDLEVAVARHPNLDRIARRAPLDRVVEQILDRPVEAFVDAMDEARLQRRLDLLVAGASPRSIDCLADELVQPQLMRVDRRLLLAREVDEVSDQDTELGKLACEVLD